MECLNLHCNGCSCTALSFLAYRVCLHERSHNDIFRASQRHVFNFRLMSLAISESDWPVQDFVLDTNWGYTIIPDPSIREAGMQD